MKSFVAFYNRGVTEGLLNPKGEAETQSNVNRIRERLEMNLNQIECANVLDGIIVHSRQEFIGSMCVSGPDEKIAQLKKFLEENTLGTVIENKVVFIGA